MPDPNNNRIVWDKESPKNQENNNGEEKKDNNLEEPITPPKGEAEILNPGFGGGETPQSVTKQTPEPVPATPKQEPSSMPEQPVSRPEAPQQPQPQGFNTNKKLGTTIVPGESNSQPQQPEPKSPAADMVWQPPQQKDQGVEPTQQPGQSIQPQPSGQQPKRTFEKDFDKIIHSKEGGTVAKMIDEARAEEEQKEEENPKSTKNLIFMILSIVLALVAIGLLFLVFFQKEPRIVEDKIVSSLIYADSHVGIDVTGLPPNKTEVLIQKVLDDRMPPGSVKQIYYLEEEMDVFRRLGVFRTMEYAGQNLDDESVTLEDAFMHGVYSSDYENPFFIAKVDSYERAYDVFRDWESAMVDDFKLFMDFPDEIQNRVVTDDFKDEIIANIPARVLRYTPEETAQVDFVEKVKRFFGKMVQPVFAQTETEENPNQLQDFTVTEEREPTTCVLTASPDDPQFEGREEEINQLKESNMRTLSVSEYNNLSSSLQELYSCVVVDINNNDPENDICIIDRAKISDEQRDDNEAINQALYKYQWETLSSNAKNYYVCFQSTGDTSVDLGDEDVLFEDGIANVCFDRATGLRTASPESDAICLSPIICVDDDGNYFENPVGFEPDNSQCFASIDILSLEKIDTFACWTNNLSLIDIIRGEAGGTCYDAFATTGAQFYSKYSIDNLRTVLRQTAALLISMEKLAKLLFLDSLSGGEQVVNLMSDVADEMIYISHIDVFRADVLRTLAGYVERTESIILTLERIGFPENSFMNEIKTAIGYIREFLGLKHNVGWVTLDGYINVDRYADPDNFVSVGDTDLDVTIIKQSLYNLGLIAEEDITVGDGTIDGLNSLDDTIIAGMISSNGILSPNPEALDEITREALIQFQEINGLDTSGVLDTRTMEFMTQVISAGGTLPGEAYTLDLFGDWTVAQFLRSGGVLIDPSGAILDGSALDGPDADYYETITVREFIESGGEIYSLTSDSGENLSIITGDLWRELRLGNYGYDVQTAQIVLREEGLDVGALNGIYDSYTEDAVREFQRLHGLEETGVIDSATIAIMNGIIADKDLSGSGYYLDADGYLQGFGEIEGIEQPGLDILPTEASGERLMPGDIIMLYLFLDENTVLFARNPETVREVVRRKANSQLTPLQ